MATAPYGVRLLVGAAVTAVEETLKLPQTILMYPVTVASTVAHIVMKVQQDIAELVTKGDSALENIFPPDEQPEWATFDEDYADDEAPAGNGERRTEGRFALYSVADAAEAGPPAAAAKRTPGKKAPGKTAGASAPAIVEELDYESLTLAAAGAPAVAERGRPRGAAGLRGGLQVARPFQTLLANRITRATAK
jgi:hypothetical protein